MPETLKPLAGMFDANQIAAMTLVLDELCIEVPSRGLLLHLPPEEIRPAIGRLIIEIETGTRRPPQELKAAVIAALEAL